MIIIRKKGEYSLKRHYRTCRTKLHSIMGCKESALATLMMTVLKFWYLNILKSYILKTLFRKIFTPKCSYIIMQVKLSIIIFLSGEILPSFQVQVQVRVVALMDNKQNSLERAQRPVVTPLVNAVSVLIKFHRNHPLQ